jgi:4-hydroxyphenylacetate 3-monooxygenase
MVKAVNGGNPSTWEMLGEVWSYAELTRSALCAAEAGAHDWGNGVWFCDERPFRALRPTLPRWFPRVNEIIKLLGAHSLLATPTAAELANPELRGLIDRYYAAAGSTSADERIRLFRTAWDFAGTALGGRNELYERFYLASAARTYQIAHFAAQADRKDQPSVVDRVLASEGDLL